MNADRESPVTGEGGLASADAQRLLLRGRRHDGARESLKQGDGEKRSKSEWHDGSRAGEAGNSVMEMGQSRHSDSLRSTRRDARRGEQRDAVDGWLG